MWTENCLVIHQGSKVVPFQYYNTRIRPHTVGCSDITLSNGNCIVSDGKSFLFFGGPLPNSCGSGTKGLSAKIQVARDGSSLYDFQITPKIGDRKIAICLVHFIIWSNQRTRLRIFISHLGQIPTRNFVTLTIQPSSSCACWIRSIQICCTTSSRSTSDSLRLRNADRGIVAILTT